MLNTAIFSFFILFWFFLEFLFDAIRELFRQIRGSFRQLREIFRQIRSSIMSFFYFLFVP